MSKSKEKLRFTPLDFDELIALRSKLLKGEKSRVIRLYDIYNGPSTRAKLADIALVAVKDMCKNGWAKKLSNNRWEVYAV